MTARATCPAAEFAQWLVREIGVATIPLSAFYADGTDHRVICFCFAKREETRRPAGERPRRLALTTDSGFWAFSRYNEVRNPEAQ